MLLPFEQEAPERTFATYEQDCEEYQKRRIKRIGSVLREQELILNGNKYKGRFMGQNKIGRYDIDDSFWEETIYWDGEGIVTPRESGEEEKFFFTTQFDEKGREIKKRDSNSLYEDLIRFYTDGRRTLIESSSIINSIALTDLVLESIYQKAKSQGQEHPKTPSFLVDLAHVPVIIYPVSFDLTSLQSKGIIRNPVINTDLRYLFQHLIH